MSLVPGLGLATPLLLAALAGALPAQGGPPPREPAPPMIEVAGQGEVTTMPDRAQVMVTVQVRAKTAAAAGTENAARAQRVIAAIRAAGIPREQVATQGFTVQPAYTYPGDGKSPILTGYDARNTVRVEVRQLEQLGRVIDAALGAGANDVAGVNFYVADPSVARRDALAAATADARLAAEAIARTAGGSLGPLVMITTEQAEAGRPIPVVASMRMEGDASKSYLQLYAPTEQQVTGRVIARWLFVPAGR
jgi:uncharacterized protein YggE